MADTKYAIRNRKSFEDCFNALNKNLDKYGQYVPWLLFKIRNQYSETDVRDALVIDTYNSTATITLPNGKVQRLSHIMLLNFEYNKSGSGTANTFSIEFAFNPAEKQDNAGELIDPEIIDQALMTSTILEIDKTSDTQKMNAVNAIAKHQVYMRMGYACDSVDSSVSKLNSPEYFGQALGASSELRDGLIIYTITGYSNITYLTNLKVTIPERGTKNSETIEGKWKVSDAMWDAIAMYFGDDDKGIHIEDRDKNVPNFHKIFPNKKVIIDNLVPEYLNEKEVYISASGESETLWEYLDRIKKLVDFPINNELEETSRVTLDWRIEEYDNIMHFYIYAIDPRIPGEGNSYTITDNDSRYVNVVYEYPTKTNNIVRSFTPEFKFETVWGDDIIVENPENSTSYYVNEKGDVYAYYNINGESDKLSGNEKLAPLASYATAVQYNYSANLTTLGIPADIPLGTIIRIRPIINGKEYHYGGYYMITKTTDRIDTNGYTTEYELFKLTKAKNSNIVKGKETLVTSNGKKDPFWELMNANGDMVIYTNEKDYQNALAKQQVQNKIETNINRKMTYNELIAAGIAQGPYTPGTEESAKKTVSTALGTNTTSSTNTKISTGVTNNRVNRTVQKTNYSDLGIRLANNVNNNKKGNGTGGGNAW